MDNLNLVDHIRPVLVSYFHNKLDYPIKSDIIAEINNTCNKIKREIQVIEIMNKLINAGNKYSTPGFTKLRELSLKRCAAMYTILSLVIEGVDKTLFNETSKLINEIVMSQFVQKTGYSLS